MNWRKLRCKLGKHVEVVNMTQPKIETTTFSCVIRYDAYMGCKHCNFTRPLANTESTNLRSMVLESFDELLGRRLQCQDSTGSKSSAESKG
jgi:hypothetical protein